MYKRQGKGAPEYWVAVVKPGRVLFEISGVPEDVTLLSQRLPEHRRFQIIHDLVSHCLLYTSRCV